jgi:hypothetical protein
MGWKIICERSQGIVEKVAEFCACELLPAGERGVLILIPYFAHLSGTFLIGETSLAYREFGFCTI